MAETYEQQAVVKWFRLQYPQYHLIAIPNGQWLAGQGKRKYALVAKYKNEGLTPGVSDLILCVKRGGFGGLWLEMKDVNKKESSLNDDQKAWISDMREAGYMARWASGFDQARKIISDYLVLPGDLK